ncbi:MAG: T9SS type A sorting domain-containing protein, partial [Bacteroidales bacterium]|nr:T9SS type A sorting domain-containing protein [Bacteroidales bacterium]
TSTLQNPTHTYTVNGIYTVSLTVTDNNSMSHTETKEAYIQVGGSSINEAAKQNIKIYPLPASERINIESESAILQLILSDLNGRVISQNSPVAKSFTLQTDMLKQGIYLLSIKLEDGIVVRKITIR